MSANFGKVCINTLGKIGYEMIRASSKKAFPHLVVAERHVFSFNINSIEQCNMTFVVGE